MKDSNFFPQNTKLSLPTNPSPSIYIWKDSSLSPCKVPTNLYFSFHEFYLFTSFYYSLLFLKFLLNFLLFLAKLDILPQRGQIIPVFEANRRIDAPSLPMITLHLTSNLDMSSLYMLCLQKGLIRVPLFSIRRKIHMPVQRSIPSAVLHEETHYNITSKLEKFFGFVSVKYLIFSNKSPSSNRCPPFLPQIVTKMMKNHSK